MTIFSCSSWSERPINCRIGGKDEEEEEEGWWETEAEERRETLKGGKPLEWLWRRQKAIVTLERQNLNERKHLASESE